MEHRIVTIINKLGLHARAASKLVELSNGFTADIYLSKEGKQVDTKNIMSILLLAAGPMTQLELTTEGPDEIAAIEAVTHLIANRFGEPE